MPFSWRVAGIRRLRPATRCAAGPACRRRRDRRCPASTTLPSVPFMTASGRSASSMARPSRLSRRPSGSGIGAAPSSGGSSRSAARSPTASARSCRGTRAPSPPPLSPTRDVRSRRKRRKRSVFPGWRISWRSPGSTWRSPPASSSSACADFSASSRASPRPGRSRRSPPPGRFSWRPPITSSPALPSPPSGPT